MLILIAASLVSSGLTSVTVKHAPPLPHSEGQRLIKKCLVRKFDNSADEDICVKEAENTCPSMGNEEQASCMVAIDHFVKRYSRHVSGSPRMPQISSTSYAKWSSAKEASCNRNADLIGPSHVFETMTCLIDARMAIVQRHAPEPTFDEKLAEQRIYGRVLEKDLAETAENLRNSTNGSYSAIEVGRAEAIRDISDDPNKRLFY